MVKKDILNLIDAFCSETYRYVESDKLDNDMEYIYSIAKEIHEADEVKLKSIYNKLLSMIGIIRFKYGFESMIINDIPELEELKKTIDNISLDSMDITSLYHNVFAIYENYISKIEDVDFIHNKYENVRGKEGLYLALESLKSLISVESYRKMLDNNQIHEILNDCVMLNNGLCSIEKIAAKYKDLIKQIWGNSLSNEIDENGNFRMLFSNISNDIDLRMQAHRLINRSGQSSCSMISSSFIATYQGETRRIGFIYPNDSDIIMASAYDLYSRSGDVGPKNKERGTTLVTPVVLEKIGIDRAKEKGEDLYSSSCYNEIIVNNNISKPCGIVVIGLGEKDLNIDFQEAQMLSLEMGLPIYYIDTMKYKNDLSEADKYYVAFHLLMSFLGMSREYLAKQIEQTNGHVLIFELINTYKEQLAEAFLTLRKDGKLNKDNMLQMMNDIIDVSKINGKNVKD